MKPIFSIRNETGKKLDKSHDFLSYILNTIACIVPETFF